MASLNCKPSLWGAAFQQGARYLSETQRNAVGAFAFNIGTQPQEQSLRIAKQRGLHSESFAEVLSCANRLTQKWNERWEMDQIFDAVKKSEGDLNVKDEADYQSILNEIQLEEDLFLKVAGTAFDKSRNRKEIGTGPLDDDRDAIIEITGHLLWYGMMEPLVRMYRAYGVYRGWEVEELNVLEADPHGTPPPKKAIDEDAAAGDIMTLTKRSRLAMEKVVLEVRGTGAYGDLQFETGYHRFEESVFERPLKLNVTVWPKISRAVISSGIEEKDLIVKFANEGGPGGTNRTTSHTKVFVRHVPTGLSVTIATGGRSARTNLQTAVDALTGMIMKQKEEKLAVARQDIKKDAETKIRILRPYDAYDLRTGERLQGDPFEDPSILKTFIESNHRRATEYFAVSLADEFN